MSYDLEERTIRFSEKVIKVCKNIKKDTITIPIIDQLIRSATSVGANYCEANGASSKLDFRNKIYTCKKESKETLYWIRIMMTTDDDFTAKGKELWNEANELVKIFSKITQTLKN